MSLMTDLAAKLKASFDRSDNKNVARRDIEGLLLENANLHDTIAKMLSARSEKEMNRWMTDIVKPAMKNSKSCLRPTYDAFFAALKGKAVNAERKCAFRALAEANAAMAKVIRETIVFLNKNFEEEVIDIHDMKLSNLAIMGMIKDSDKLADFSTYLYTLACRISVDDGASIPRYREAFLKENASSIGKMVSDILEGKGAARFVTDMTRLVENGKDIIVGVGGNFDFHRNVGPVNFVDSIFDRIAAVLHSLNIFAHALDYIDDYKIRKYNRNKEIKEWLEQHNAILRLELANMDKSSPEYAKLVNIIKAYDEQIAEFDQAIREFEEE